ncbi:MAG TPA: helix-turn-helix transcriptional regulator [Dongiaceae bacterium]|nr:helix-turn-helix transcriptional regulator [Dongiaceae bacterium]
MLKSRLDIQNILINGTAMITAAQLRAARALLGVDQRELAELADLSVPTIQRMEASEGVVRGTVDSLMKLVNALDAAGIELIGEGAASQTGGRGVRLKERVSTTKAFRGKSPKTAPMRVA